MSATPQRCDVEIQMHNATVAIVIVLAVALSAVGAVSAMGVYDMSTRTASDENGAVMDGGAMSGECNQWMEDNGMENTERMSVERCMQRMNGNATVGPNSEDKGGMMRGSMSRIGCH